MASSINASTSAGLVNQADTSGILNLQTAGTTAIAIDASQNVTLNNVIPSGSTAPTNGMFLPAANTVGLSTASTERMRIDSSGNLLVNSTTNLSARGSNPKTFINAGASDTLGLQNTLNTQSNLYSYVTTTSGTRYHCVFGDGTNNNVGYIASNGSSVTYSTTSDYRLKENVLPMVGALDTVAQLKPVTYTWKQNGSDGQGFIAHELAEFVPDCVTGEKDAVNEDGSIKPQGVDTSFLVATLTAAIQEQQTLIVSQSELINSLTARVTALEAK